MFNFLSAVSLRFCFMNVIQVSLSVQNNGTIQLFSENTGCPKHTQNNLLFTHTQNSLLSTPTQNSLLSIHTQNSLLSTHTKNSLLYKILRSVRFPRRPRTVCFTKYLDQSAFHADLEQSALQNTQISLLSTPTQNSLLSTHTQNSLLYKILRSVCFPHVIVVISLIPLIQPGFIRLECRGIKSISHLQSIAINSSYYPPCLLLRRNVQKAFS